MCRSDYSYSLRLLFQSGSTSRSICSALGNIFLTTPETIIRDQWPNISHEESSRLGIESPKLGMFHFRTTNRFPAKLPRIQDYSQYRHVKQKHSCRPLFPDRRRTIHQAQMNHKSCVYPQSPLSGHAPTQVDARPRCFEHGCGGRHFSCTENFNRHMREKNGLSVVVCDFCLITFSRESNRDHHIRERRCKILTKFDA